MTLCVNVLGYLNMVDISRGSIESGDGEHGDHTDSSSFDGNFDGLAL